MKPFKYLSLAALTAVISYGAQAQDFTDALRYSYLTPQGTARSMGFGNALGSIGGDFATVNVNPAGLGIYKSSELMFTPSLKVNSMDAAYQGNSESNNNTRFNFNNVGLVLTSARRGQRYDKSKWKAVSFAVGFNRLADFNRDYSYSGINSGPTSSSATEAYVDDANYYMDVQTENTPAYIGWESGILDFDTAAANPYGGTGLYYTVVPFESGIVQSRTVRERGGTNELTFSLGANYMEKLMLGATLGIPIINYRRTSTYTETPQAIVNDFISYTNSEELVTKGTGINLKLGAIYKVSDYFRLGAAVHTPTWYGMNDEVSSAVTGNTGLYGALTISSGSVFSYSMSTPWRANLSATGFLGTYGFITADYEYVNYASARLYYDAGFEEFEKNTNQQIKNTLQGASNFRVGAEGRITDFFMIRLGFNYLGNPYKNTGSDYNSMAFTGGLGLRFESWYVDLGLVHTQAKNWEQPYSSPYANVIVPTAAFKNNFNNAALTIGFKF